GAESVRDALLSFCSDTGVQKIVGDLLGDSTAGAKREMFLLGNIDRCELEEFSSGGTSRGGGLLERGGPEGRLRSLNLVRALQMTGLDNRIEKIAFSETSSPDLRTTALAVFVRRHPGLDDAALKFLTSRLAKTNDAAARLTAAQVLGKAKLT